MSDNPAMSTTDKFERHYRQQLSALVDGELSADESRFLLRRLAHDEELAGCHERWQLCGDVLRGAASAPAPLDFAARVRSAIADEPAPQAQPAPRSAARWRWGAGRRLLRRLPQLPCSWRASACRKRCRQPRLCRSMPPRRKCLPSHSRQSRRRRRPPPIRPIPATVVRSSRQCRLRHWLPRGAVPPPVSNRWRAARRRVSNRLRHGWWPPRLRLLRQR